MIRALSPLRSRLLLSTCAILCPTFAQGQTVNTAQGQQNIRDGNPTLSITSTGSVTATAAQSKAIQVFNSTDTTASAGPTINNAGTIRNTDNVQGRAIDYTNGVDGTFRTITINNLSGGLITATSDAIRIGNNVSTATNSAIVITNSGTITSTGVTTGGAVATATATAAITTTNIPNATLDITNNQGGVISGSRGIALGAATSTVSIVNNGTITGTGVNPDTTATQNGEAIRIGGNANVTLGASSVTENSTLSTNANALAINFTAASSHTLNVNAGATVSGGIAGAAGIDTLNLIGPASGTFGRVTQFEQLNVQSGTWSATATPIFTSGVLVNSGALLRFDAGGIVRGTITNNGEVVFNGIADTPQTLNSANQSSLTGTGILRLTGAGAAFVLTPAANLTTPNSYSGATIIEAGTLRAGAPFAGSDGTTPSGANAFSPNSAIQVGANGAVDLNGYDQTVLNISGDGAVETTGANTTAGGILTTGSGGGLTTLNGGVAGLGGITKVGTGTLTLTATSSATGVLRASAGEVSLTGSWAGAGQADNGGSFAGSGSLLGVLAVADGGTVAPGVGGIGTLTTGGLALSAGSVLAYDLGDPGVGDRVQVNGNLILDGTLNVADAGGFGQGVYRLIDYTGALTDNGLVMGTLPAGANAQAAVQTGVTGQVNLIYGNITGPTIQFWDGASQSANGTIDGGAGSWTNNLANWTTADGAANMAWNGNFAVFQGAAGVVTVNDAISFNGMQFITDGYTVAGGSGALTATGQSTIRVNPGVTAIISASIGGGGGAALLKNDTGTLILTGANSYGGSTTVAGGTLRAEAAGTLPGTTAVLVQAGGALDIGASQTVGSLAGDAGSVVTLSGGSLTSGGLANATTTFAGTVSGAGGLIKVGTGALTLSSVNSFTGGTTVNGGTVTAAAANAFGTGDLAVANGATANFSGFEQNLGTLSGAGQIVLGIGGRLTTTSAATTTFGGAITGTGATFTKAGGGALALSGANTFGGAVVVSGGRLVVSGSLSGAPTAAIDAGGTLQLTANQTLGGLSGTGALVLTGARLTVGGPGAFGGVASGAGGITMSGPGVLTLAGTNTYTGDTIASGGTLLVNGGIAGGASATGIGAFGGTGTVAGTLTIANGATLTPGSGGAGTLTVGGLTLNANSMLAYDLGAANTATNDRVQVNGNLVLDGTLNVSDLGGFGQGVYRLIDYTGGLTDNSLVVGTLPSSVTAPQTSVQTSVANQVNLVVSQALPDIEFWDGTNTSANGRVDGGSGSWNNQQANWTSAAGDSNVRWGGRFAVFQGAAGTVTVDDAITFTGMQFLTSGYTINAGAGALTTSTAASAIRVDPGVTATIGASIGGSGGIAKLDVGTLILAGANSYTGATAVNGGVLRATAVGALPGATTVTVASGATLDVAANQTIGNLAGAGAVTLSGGSLTTGGANAAATFSGVLSGAGGLTKVGTGTATLAGANSYTGTTAVNAGTLALGTGGRLGAGALSVAAGATLNLADVSIGVGDLSGAGAIQLGSGTLAATETNNTSFTGVISGSGGLSKAGAGTLTLSGSNPFTGAVNVRAGTLTVGTATALANTAAVQVDSGAILALSTAKTVSSLSGSGSTTLGGLLTVSAGDYSGVISGTSGLTKTGTTTLMLSGANTYTGATAVSAGRLVVNGSIASAVNVATGALLGGTGRVGTGTGVGLTVNGTLAPGNSIGTLSVNGNLAFNAGSVFQVETNAAGQSDQVVASGTATIAGGTVQVISGGASNYAVATAYPILTASSVTGAFTAATSDFAFLTPSLRYSTSAVTLVLIRNDLNFASIGQTANQRGVAEAVQQIGSGAAYDALVLSNAGTARTVLDTLSGEIYADALTAANRGSQEARSIMSRRLQAARGDGVALWVDGRSDMTKIDASRGLGRLDWDGTYLAGGVDATYADLRVGFGYRHGDDRLDLASRTSHTSIDTETGFVYVGANIGPAQFAGGASLSWHVADTDRVLGASTLRSIDYGREKGRSHQVFGEVSFDLGQGQDHWGPYGGVSAASTTLRGLAEQGTVATALVVGRSKLVTTVADYGLRASGPLFKLRNKRITVSADIGGRTYIDDNTALRNIRFAAGGQAFAIEGLDFGETTLTTRVSASLQTLGGTLGIGFNGQVGSRYKSYGGQLSGGWRF